MAKYRGIIRVVVRGSQAFASVNIILVEVMCIVHLAQGPDIAIPSQEGRRLVEYSNSAKTAFNMPM